MNMHWNTQKWRDSPHLKWGVGALFLLLLAIVAVQGWMIHGQSNQKHSSQVHTSLTDPLWNRPFGGTGIGRQKLFPDMDQDPFRAMQQEMDALWSTFSSQSMGWPWSVMHTPYGFSSISGFEVEVEPDKVVVIGKVPDAALSDLEVTVQHGRLVIDYEGRQRDDASQDHDKFGGYVRQRSFSSRFKKAITLPDDVDPTGMKTEVEDGVLTVTIPRSGHPMP